MPDTNIVLHGKTACSHLAGLLGTTDALYAKYNIFLYENGYGAEYDLGEARMFVIEGMEKVRKVVEENRRRKLTSIRKSRTIPSLRLITVLRLKS